MSFLKTKLKAARDAIGRKDYVTARDASLEVLNYEPDNYNANVFLGLAHVELGEYEKSEQVYKKAIESNRDQVLAWQGLSKLYERAQTWDKYAQSLQGLIQLFSASRDSVKCAETLQRFIQLKRDHGTRTELTNALSMLLPDSELYDIISMLPEPDPTNPTSTTTFQVQEAVYNNLPILEEIVELSEKDEAETINSEIQKRRTRLNAPSPEQLKKDVGLEVWSSSKLPDFYNQILNHPNTSDGLRRQTDCKLLRHKQKYLYALPTTGDFAQTKMKVCGEVDTLINGAIILEIPDDLAWTLFIEQKDCESLEEYDVSLLRKFARLFPDHPLTSVLRGYFLYMSIPLTECTSEEDQPSIPDDPEQGFDIILDSYPIISQSLLASRIVLDVYLRERDYSNAIVTSDESLRILTRLETNTGKKLPKVWIGLQATLATSLVHLFPPKHHARAMRIIEGVLAQNPEQMLCLMGQGYILRDAGRWADAAEVFSKVTGLAPDDPGHGLRAKEEYAWCCCQTGHIEKGLVVLSEVLKALEQKDTCNFDCARCLWRIGQCHWDTGNEQREEAYRYFIASLKQESTYAPAFVSLGIYYSEFVSDPARASKCFQKAFELDSREADAARRLAVGFADEKEWDLVEVVARRCIEGEGGLNAGLKGSYTENVAARYKPTNTWAWKAVGVVELGNVSSAIQNLQIALRAEPDNPLTWLRLGEAYSHAGRHVAALKALERVRELQADDWVAAYFIGDVYRQMGQYQFALDAFQPILKDRPTEAGVLASSAQTYLDLGRNQLNDGFIARAELSLSSAVEIAVNAMVDNPGFRSVLWKLVGDAIFLLSSRMAFIDEPPVRTALALASNALSRESTTHLTGIVDSIEFNFQQPLDGSKVLDIALATYEHRLVLGSTESTVMGSAWFDLGIAVRIWTIRKPSNPQLQIAQAKVVECLTQALRNSPDNDTYWMVLGDAYFVSDARLAQHAYIKALEIDPKNAKTWTNLGLLYLHHDDLELANEALYRAQTLDPDYTLAWVGQGLVAEANGHKRDTTLLFTHAVTLAVLPEADIQFSSRLFGSLAEQPPPLIEFLLPVFSVLGRYCQQCPNDPNGLHLHGLVCEALGLLELAIEQISKAISILETEYEETESQEIEMQFCIAHTNMGRLRLTIQDYRSSIQSFESALGLLPNDTEPRTVVLRTQAQLGLGLANSKLSDPDTALAFFEAAIESAGDNSTLRGQVTVLSAQTLWNIGTEEFKESAKAQLLQCIASDPDNLTAIKMLATMGILTDDDGLVDAALSEILALPFERRHELDPQRDVNRLLVQHHLGQGHLSQALLTAQKMVFAEPDRLQGRKDLATLALQSGNTRSVLPILSGSSTSSVVEGRETLGLVAVAEATSNGKHLRYAQKAVMVTPWDRKNWQILTLVRKVLPKE